jgi:hypothetical protein
MKKIVFLLAFLWAIPALATDYYVKTGGNDSLSGLDDANAWATIAKVQATVTTGDTVYFRSQDSWTGANPLIYAVAGVTYDGSTYGSGTRATLQASSRVDSNGMVQIAKSNVTFQGFKVDGNLRSMSGIAIGYTNPLPTGNISGITVHNNEVTNGITTDSPSPAYYYGIHVSMSGSSAQTASNLTITNNWVHHTGHEGIAIYPQTSTASKIDTVLVRGNIINNTGLTGVRGNPLDIANDSDNVTIEYNYLANNPSGIAISSYGMVCYGAPSPDNVILRYNLLNTSGGITISGYFCQEGIDGYGAIYGNVVIYGGLALIAHDYKDKSWKIYNNVFLTNYSIGKGTYVLDAYTYRTPLGLAGVEIKNNIFYGTGLRVIRDPWNAMAGATHANNLFYRSDSAADVAQISVVKDANAIASTSVAITNDATYTYFTKSGGADWTTKFVAGNSVKWSGFANSGFNDRLINVLTVSADVIKAYKIYIDGVLKTETATVTGASWQTSNISAATLKSSWEATAVITNPAFTGGTLPTGFTGTYGTDMVPNTTYFSLPIDSPAVNTGATLGAPYNGSINGAALTVPVTRPQGAGYDIGAYEFFEAAAQFYQVTIADTATYANQLVDCANVAMAIGLRITGAAKVNNYTVARCPGGGIVADESATINNTIASSISIASGKTVTGSHNLFTASAKAGDGTYTDVGGTLWSSDPLFISAVDFRLQPTSPAVRGGAFVTGVHDQPGCADSAGIPCNSMAIPIGAYSTATAQPTYHGPRH